MMAAMMGASLSVGMITEIAISDFPREIVDLLDYITPMEEPWYQDGLRFRCTRCGNCCTGAPGYVWVDDAEIAAIAEYRDEPVDETCGLYTRPVGRRRSLREKANSDCIFFDRDEGCTIYEARP